MICWICNKEGVKLYKLPGENHLTGVCSKCIYKLEAGKSLSYTRILAPIKKTWWQKLYTYLHRIIAVWYN